MQQKQLLKENSNNQSFDKNFLKINGNYLGLKGDVKIPIHSFYDIFKVIVRGTDKSPIEGIQTYLSVQDLSAKFQILSTNQQFSQEERDLFAEMSALYSQLTIKWL